MNVFVDSNTLLYPLQKGETVKGAICRAWLNHLRDTHLLTMSPQVLNETFWSVSRKSSFIDARPVIRKYLSEYFVWAVAPLNSNTLSEAWALQDRYRLGFWDALLLASANAIGARFFLSEDLNDGQVYGQVRVIDPVRNTPRSITGKLLY